MRAARDNAYMPDLATLGWDDAWSVAFEPYRSDGLVPGRVTAPHRRGYDVLTAAGEVRARLAGRVRRASDPAALPAVGDWVALDDKGAIVHVLPRRTKFSRRAAHDPVSGDAREQVVAANVDVVFVALAIDQEIDGRVLERYLTLVFESGAAPVVLLTKADVVDAGPAIEPVIEEVRRIARNVPVHAVSGRTGAGLEHVRSHLSSGVTGALLGASGVGKSTLVNTLVGNAELLATGDVQPDGAGRHTTTRRQLVPLPGEGILIDNPGMRRIHLWLADDGLAEVFDDVEELAAQCRFSDCRHESEPGCAVRAALADGSLPRERWESFRALERELEELADRLEQQERSRARRRRPGAGSS